MLNLLIMEADFFETFVNKIQQACFKNDISIHSWIKIIALMQKQI